MLINFLNKIMVLYSNRENNSQNTGTFRRFCRRLAIVPHIIAAHVNPAHWIRAERRHGEYRVRSRYDGCFAHRHELCRVRRPFGFHSYAAPKAPQTLRRATRIDFCAGGNAQHAYD